MKEADLQRAVANYLDNHERLFKSFVWFHPTTWSPNKIQGAKMKREGSKAGVPDCCILTRHGGSVFIELKTKKGSVSPEQKRFHEKLGNLMHPVYVVKTDCPIEAVNKVEQILKIEEVL